MFTTRRRLGRLAARGLRAIDRGTLKFVRRSQAAPLNRTAATLSHVGQGGLWFGLAPLIGGGRPAVLSPTGDGDLHARDRLSVFGFGPAFPRRRQTTPLRPRQPIAGSVSPVRVATLGPSSRRVRRGRDPRLVRTAPASMDPPRRRDRRDFARRRRRSLSERRHCWRPPGQRDRPSGTRARPAPIEPR
jgi:hypothetical protein